MGLKDDKSEEQKLSQYNLFLDCLLSLKIPIEIYEELGLDALSITEKERVNICGQLAIGILPTIDPTLFDEETLNLIVNYIKKTVM